MFVHAPRSDHSARDWLSLPLAGVTVPLAVGVIALCFAFWHEWSVNPDLSHGFFAPLIFALLVWEGSRSGTARWLNLGRWSSLVVGLILIGALAAATLAGLLAASVGWTHAVVLFCFAGALVALLTAGLVVLADDRVRAVPFNWPILTAIGLWILVAPLPTGTYARITLGLQHFVATGVLNSLHLLGIPARQAGNIIELASTSVGVEDACSGIRSLISCLYAGFFFAAWLVRSAGKRTVLIFVAPLLAIAMNFARSLLLTLLANSGKEITGFWHDTTGYAILGLTAAMLAGLAALLSPAGAPSLTPTQPVTTRPRRASLWVFGAGSTALAAAALFFFLASRPTAAATGQVAFPVESLLPEKAEGWQVRTTDDLYRFSGVLQTEHLVERSYLRTSDGQPIFLNVYVAHWEPGAASVSLVASHTPDACWPGAGWQVQEVPERRVALAVGDQTLVPAEHRMFRFGEAPQHVWFWHVYDGRVIGYRDPYSIPALVKIALNYGFSRDGPQYFIRISSNAPWEKLRHEPLIQEIIANLSRVGLRP